MKKILRSIQTFFPFLHDMRFRVKFCIMKIRHHPHEYDFRAIQFFKPDVDQVFVDIGSNRGESVLSMLLMSSSKRRIIGFEPNPFIYKKLENKFHKKEDVVIHNVGLAENDKELDLYIPFYRKWMFDGLGSFKYEAAANWLKTRLWLFNEKRLSIKQARCQIKKLDDFKLKPYFIKIDVQGYELEVLKGSFETIKAHSPIILIESIDDREEKFLKQFNYQVYRFENGKFLEGYGKLNTYCIVKERHPELML